MLWPLIIAVFFLFLKEGQIIRKTLFLISAVLTGYVAMIGGSVGIIHILIKISSSNKIFIFLMECLPWAVAFLLPVLTAFILARFFFPKKREEKGTSSIFTEHVG